MARPSTSSAISRPPAAERRPRSAGFTILEVLVVIGIVLTLGAVVLPFTLREVEQRREAEAFDRFGQSVTFNPMVGKNEGYRSDRALYDGKHDKKSGKYERQVTIIGSMVEVNRALQYIRW